MPDWRDELTHPIYASEMRGGDGRPTVSVARSAQGYHFTYADDTRVWIDRDGRSVWCTWRYEATLADTATYLAGPILSFVLRLRGALALHASAVVIDDRAVVLAGPHAAGKSTAAATLGLRGFRVLADDVLHAVESEGGWRAEPFTGLLRLWPDAEVLLLGTRDRLPRITTTWDKRALPIGSYGVEPAAGACPIGGLVLLEWGEPEAAAASLEAIGPAEALIRLTANTSAAHLLDMDQRAKEFGRLSSLVRKVPAARLVRLAGAPLEAQARAIVDWMRASPQCQHG